MSSDESEATNISSVSSRSGKNKKQRSCKAKKWEIDLIGDFLLNLYNRSFITTKDDWCVKKAELQEKFVEYTNAEQRQKLKELNGTYNVGNLLDRCGFLLSTAGDSSLYKIRYSPPLENLNNKAEKWEIDLLGNFLLILYNQSFITPKDDWCVKKSELREKFVKYTNAEQRQKLKALYGTYHNIGHLLNRCGFLINTARDSSLYKISHSTLFEYRDNKIKSLDKSKMNNDESKQVTTEEKTSNSQVKPLAEEIDLIGNFLLDLYHRSFITPKDDWCVKKSELREKFVEYTNAEQRQKLKELHGTYNVGNLLDRCGFLINTARDSSLYRIKYLALFEYRNNKIKRLDKSKMNNDETKQVTMEEKTSNNKFKPFEEEIDQNEPRKFLKYQGTTMQRREQSFVSTNMSCFICQEEFITMESFEDHVQIHGGETDFEFSKKLDKFNSPLFTISYRLCTNSHNFCFEIETSLEDVVIEKIMIVQSRSFFYVNNMRVPYKWPENGIDRFFVDSHLFVKHFEQPIVILCHIENSKETLFVEQHHFMRIEEFPKVHFAINTNRLSNNKLFEPKFGLADYFPPKEIQDALKDDIFHLNLMKTSNEFRDYIRNDRKLQPQTIGASLNILLQIEDMDTIKEYLKLKQKNVKIRSFGDEYSFQLDPNHRGVVENLISLYDEVVLTARKDLLNNDEKLKQLLLQNTEDILHNSGNTFVGMIMAIVNGRISFKCSTIIDLQGSYAVTFRPSRINFRYQYRALELLPVNMGFLKKFLFPTKVDTIPMPDISVDLFNKSINEEQLQAVRNIATGPRADATYVIFGPPGTGKTTTLVEGILQLLRKPDTRILVAASSNSACDEVGLRLCRYLPELDIPRCFVRIFSRSSELRTELIDDVLLENSNMYDGQFYPDIDVLHQYRVVVCTLSVVGKLATGKFGRRNDGAGVFTHLFIDEIAASMESEALMAITAVLTHNSRLVIAGDHKQLGPVLKSMRAKDLGLDRTLMDRLLERDCYRVDVDTGNYDRTIQTRLIRNYRSHPAIVNLYSGLYYNHSLEPCAKLTDVSWNEVWHKSRNSEYPILFHAIYEPSRNDTESYSLFNMTESEVVMDYVTDLMYFGINGHPVKQTDIGIISPYKRQYKYIQEQLNLRRWFDIETGSVELFQGKEKNIIIVSFVRSGTSHLGFLDNPRRLNVTLSRPKCLLILIGNPKTLSLNKDFEYVIKECKRHNTFVGSDCPPRSNFNKNMPEPFRRAQNRGCLPQQPASSVSKNVSRTSGKKDDLHNLLSDNLDKVLVINEKKNQEKGKREGKKNRGRRRPRRNRDKKRIGYNYYELSDVKKTEGNKDKSDNEDDDDDDDDDDIDSISTKSGSSISNTNAGKGSVGAASNVGMRGQTYMQDRNKNKPNKIESIFNELPQVPQTSATTKPNYTMEQVLLLQQQQRQHLHLLQQNSNCYQNPNPFNPYFNTPTNANAFRAPAPTYNPFLNQPQQHYHNHFQYQTNQNYMQANNISRPPFNNPYPLNYNQNELSYQSPFNNISDVNLQKQRSEALGASQAYNLVHENKKVTANVLKATEDNTSNSPALKKETNKNQRKTSDSSAHKNDTKRNQEKPQAEVLSSVQTKNDSKSNPQKEAKDSNYTVQEMKTNEQKAAQAKANISSALKNDSKSNQQKERANASNITESKAKNSPAQVMKTNQQVLKETQTNPNNSPAHNNKPRANQQKKPTTALNATQEKANNSPAHKIETRVFEWRSRAGAPNTTPTKASNSSASYNMETKTKIGELIRTCKEKAATYTNTTLYPDIITSSNRAENPNSAARIFNALSVNNSNTNVLTTKREAETLASSARIFSTLTTEKQTYSQDTIEQRDKDNIFNSIKLEPSKSFDTMTAASKLKNLAPKEKQSETINSNNWRIRDEENNKSPIRKALETSSNWRIKDDIANSCSSTKAETIKPSSNWKIKDEAKHLPVTVSTTSKTESSSNWSIKNDNTNNSASTKAETITPSSNWKIKDNEANLAFSNKVDPTKHLPVHLPVPAPRTNTQNLAFKETPSTSFANPNNIATSNSKTDKSSNLPNNNTANYKENTRSTSVRVNQGLAPLPSNTSNLNSKERFRNENKTDDLTRFATGSKSLSPSTASSNTSNSNSFYSNYYTNATEHPYNLNNLNSANSAYSRNLYSSPSTSYSSNSTYSSNARPTYQRSKTMYPQEEERSRSTKKKEKGCIIA